MRQPQRAVHRAPLDPATMAARHRRPGRPSQLFALRPAVARGWLPRLRRAQESDQGAMQQALAHCQAVLDARRRQDAASGAAQPGADTLTSLQSVGMILRALGRAGEALELLRQAQAGMEAAHGRASKQALRCSGVLGRGAGGAAAAGVGGTGRQALKRCAPLGRRRSLNDVAFTLVSMGAPEEGEALLLAGLQEIDAAAAGNPESLSASHVMQHAPWLWRAAPPPRCSAAHEPPLKVLTLLRCAAS